MMRSLRGPVDCKTGLTGGVKEAAGEVVEVGLYSAFIRPLFGLYSAFIVSPFIMKIGAALVT
jgi:hypothetical protein